MSRQNHPNSKQGMPLPPKTPAAPAAGVMPPPPSFDEQAQGDSDAPEEMSELEKLRAQLVETEAENARLKAEKEELAEANSSDETLRLRNELSNLAQENAALRSGVKREKAKRPVKIEPMKVKAIRPGHYGQSRIPTDKEFVIQGEHELGSWMQVLGPAEAQVKEKKK